MLISKVKHALRRICSIVLSKPIDSTTLDDIEQVKSIFQLMIDSGLSPKQIQEKYNIEYSDFGMFLKRCLGMTIRSHKSALQNFHTKNGTLITNAKNRYYQDCKFKFQLRGAMFVPGYENLDTLGLYHPTKNPNGLCRDHMISIAFGWANNIDPKIISHPANCQLISNQENIAKGSTSCIALNQLLERIENINLLPIKTKIITPRTDTHKKNISNSILKINQEKRKRNKNCRETKERWCPGRDSNSQFFRRRGLRPLCIPFHHPGVFLFIRHRGIIFKMVSNDRLLDQSFPHCRAQSQLL